MLKLLLHNHDGTTIPAAMPKNFGSVYTSCALEYELCELDKELRLTTRLYDLMPQPDDDGTWHAWERWDDAKARP